MTEPDRILRLPHVCSRTGLARSTLYEKMERGEFPKQRKLSARAVGWLQSEIDAWINAREHVGVSTGASPESHAA